MSPALRVCVFGGTAAYHLTLSAHVARVESVAVDTPYGRADFSGLVTHAGAQVLFSSRHGRGSLERSAAFVNHRANVWAAHKLGVDVLLSWNGCGALSQMLNVGDLLVPDDLLDQTRARIYSYRADPDPAPARTRLPGEALPSGDARVFWEPARQALLRAARAANHNVHAWGTYACTEGPRLESPAEIRMLSEAGAAVVGMTLSPEVWLAAELGLHYASLCFVSNWATGLAERHGNERRFGPEVGVLCLQVTLAAAEALCTGNMPA